MADYRVETLDLTLVGDRKELVSRNTVVANVVILEFAGGTDFKLHFGQRAAIPVKSQGLDFRLCPEENEGVFFTNSAQPGTTIIVLIGFGEGAEGLQVGA